MIGPRSILALFSLLSVVYAGVTDRESYEPVTGIDLGTTYSCVGIYRGGRVEIIANSQGKRTTPSWVAFQGNEHLVGDAAKHAFHTSPEQTVYSVKRLIGRKFDDPDLQCDIAHWPFHVVDRGGRLMIDIRSQGCLYDFTPEEISSMILVKMKETVEAYLGMKVSHAVSTVLAYFNDAQRQATKDAGTIAALNILRIVNEPTAAAIAYGLDRQQSGLSRIIVYDLGGGTLDVSLLSVQDGVFKVLATSGDAHLGGEDFDAHLIKHFTDLYEQRSGIDVTLNPRSMSKLKKEVEHAKRALSSQMTITLEIESFYQGRDFSETLTRAKFEQLNLDLFRKTLGPVRQVLADAKLSPKSIDEIVLVGGSTRIPKVRELLKEMFGGREPSQGINPDEAVAVGAAIHAGMLLGEEGLEDVSLADICPFTIGIETAGGTFTPFIRRNPPLPAMHSEMLALSTIEDNQSTVLIWVFEGERVVAEQNTLIGEFELSEIPSATSGIVQIEVEIQLDANSILRVEAKESLNGNSNSIEISSRRGGLSDEELDQLATKSRKHSLDNATRRARVEKCNRLQTLLWNLENKLSDRKYIAQLARQGCNSTHIDVAVHDMLLWLKLNESTASPDELDQKHATITSLVGVE